MNMVTAFTLKPFFRVRKRMKNTHDWFALNIYVCNELSFAISLFGYGIAFGVLVYDVLKAMEGKNNG